MNRSIIALPALLVLLPACLSYAADRPFIFGINPVSALDIGKDPTAHDPQVYKAIADAGGAIVRVRFDWERIERVKGKPDWNYLDKQVELAVDNNLAIVGLINSTPSWASPTGRDTPFYAPKMENKADFQRFCKALVARYRGRIKYWEFWNEANGYGWHTDRGYNLAEEYVPWLKIAYKTLKAADPWCLVGLTGLDDADGNAPIYLRKVYEFGGKGYFDAVVDHPYYGEGQYKPDKVLALREIMRENGDGDLPIWITEMGWDSKNREQEVAGYLTDYLDKLSKPDFDYIPIATYHTICDFSLQYGLMNKKFEPRPAYKAFKSYPKPARPVISDVRAEPAGGGAVVITCKTDIPCTARALYGETRNYGSLTPLVLDIDTDHTITITGLKPGRTYHYRVRAATGTYNFSFSKNGEVRVK